MKNFPQALKDLGQHFLNCPKVIKSITEDFHEEASGILEVGPGPGVLTEFLAKHELPIHVVEKDPRFPPYIAPHIGESAITLADALKVDLNQIIDHSKLGSKVWLVSNLPYNVSVPLLRRFMDIHSIQMMTLMFQREVANKAFAIDTPKKKSMNSLMALCQSYFDLTVNCHVPPGSFTPPPKVDSTVLSFTRKRETFLPLDQLGSLEKFLRQCFQFKRKTLVKNLGNIMKRDQLLPFFDEQGLSPLIRAEALTLEQIQSLYLFYQKGLTP